MNKTREERICFVCHDGHIREIHRGHKVLFQCFHCGRVNERFWERRGKTRVKKTSKGLIHYSAGALIEKDLKYMVSKRTHYPYLYTLIGGHVDKGEDMGEALAREIKEETGLKIKDKKLIFKGTINPDPCTRGVNIHYWNLFLVHAKGTLKMNVCESVHIRWLTKSQMARLHFTPPVTYIFKKINFLKSVCV